MCLLACLSNAREFVVLSHKDCASYLLLTLPLQVLHVIGFGSVGQAALKMFQRVLKDGLLSNVKAINYHAPEIKEKSADGIFTFSPGPIVTRETLIPLLDSVSCLGWEDLCVGGSRARGRPAPPSQQPV